MKILQIATRQAQRFFLDPMIIEDRQLSFRARGILTYLLTRPDDYEVTIEKLVAESPTDGKDAVRMTLIELEKAGYILRRRRISATGQRMGWETLVYDMPQESDNYAKRDAPDHAARRAARRQARQSIAKDYPKIFLSLGRQHGFHCQQCGAVDALQIDHILPLAQGGENRHDNLQLLCMPCNMRKGASIHEQDI